MPASSFDAFANEKNCRRRLAVTLSDYQQAVKTLLPVAFTSSSGGRITANLLLSLYDSDSYPFPIDDLGLLDLELLEQSMIAIRGRLLLGQVPQIVIPDGGTQFSRLVVQWPQLQASQRYGAAMDQLAGNF